MNRGAEMVNDGVDTADRAGGAEPTGPIAVTDLLLPAADLAEHGRHIDACALPHWHYLEAWTWVATRDLGQVAGMRRWLNDARPDAGGITGMIMATISQTEPMSALTSDGAFTDLNRALANGELQSVGRREGGELAAMPAEAWTKGRYTEGDGGTWWEGKPLLSPRWTDIRISRIDIETCFSGKGNSLPIRSPDAGTWVPLTAALMWITFHHAADIDELNRLPLAMVGHSHEHIRALLEWAWRKLADAASQGHLIVRGRTHDGSQSCDAETDLARDDLLNCKWFDWAIGDRDQEIVSAIYCVKPNDELALVRSGMAHYSYVRVEREGLMRLWPVPAAETSMGLALSQQLGRVFDFSRVGDLVPLAEALGRVAATFSPVEDWQGSPERLVTAERVGEAIKDRLRGLLKTGTVQSYVCKQDGSYWRIPSGYWGSWHDWRPLAGSAFYTEASHGPLAHSMNEMGVHVALAELQAALGPAAVAAATTAKVRSDMEAWLERMVGSLAIRSYSKADFASEATRRFGTKRATFDAAWSRVTFDKPDWTAAGPRPKNRNPLSTID